MEQKAKQREEEEEEEEKKELAKNKLKWNVAK